MSGSRFSGFALLAGGVVTLIVNAALSPIMLQLPSEQIHASDIFLVRLSLASLGVLLLQAGSVALYQRHVVRAKAFGAISFWLMFAGTAFLFAHEWGQVFFLHPLARIAPEALPAMEEGSRFNLYNAEAIVVVTVFMLGWLLLSISMLMARSVPRLGPTLIVAGFFAIPLLTAAAHALVGPSQAFWGAVVGNLVLSSGWILLGRELMRPAA